MGLAFFYQATPAREIVVLTARAWIDLGLSVLNGSLVVSVVGYAVRLWATGAASLGTVAAARAEGMTYNRFMSGLRKAGVEVDRKILAELAVNDVAAFQALVAVAKDNQTAAAA